MFKILLMFIFEFTTMTKRSKDTASSSSDCKKIKIKIEKVPSSSSFAQMHDMMDERKKSLVDMLDGDSSVGNKTFSDIDDIRHQRNNKGFINIHLKLVYMDEPTFKKTTSDIVHLYFCDVLRAETRDEIEEFGKKLKGIFSTSRGILPVELNEALLRVTLWDVTIDQVENMFSVGDCIHIRNVGKINEYRGMLQLNSRLQNLTRK
jgi:hypothetical protein